MCLIKYQNIPYDHHRWICIDWAERGQISRLLGTRGQSKSHRIGLDDFSDLYEVSQQTDREEQK